MIFFTFFINTIILKPKNLLFEIFNSIWPHCAGPLQTKSLRDVYPFPSRQVVDLCSSYERKKVYPHASEASREVANFSERKNTFPWMLQKVGGTRSKTSFKDQCMPESSALCIFVVKVRLCLVFIYKTNTLHTNFFSFIYIT